MSAMKIFPVFTVFVMLSSLLMSDAGTIHSSLGTGDSKNGWKPGGKRNIGGLDCQYLSSEALNTLFNILEEINQKLAYCVRIKYGLQPTEKYISSFF